MKERIQKVIAETGEYSRRAVERLIAAKKIKVNGVVVTTQGLKINPFHDRVQIDGKAFHYKPQQETIAILINKPRRVLVTRSDDKGRKTVYDLLPKKMANLKPVGRLDYNTQGALILTNDGDLILKLTHPSYHLEKIYHVKVSSFPDEKQLERMRRGIILDGARTLPAQIKVISKNKSTALLEFKLEEGKNRQIRRMCEEVGLTVKELRRVAIGHIQLKSLRSGGYRELQPSELKKIKV